ncbi:hypothetical protein C8R43DRAFT_1122722 [Mycena crocata]|nr:hypothetical protein C8R43DRAFT_1122722 [Mycena crocata]
MSPPAATNLSADEVIMDRRGARDARYYCLPPFRGDPTQPNRYKGKGYRYHVVFQGHVVGTFDNWAAAQRSLAGFSGNSNEGFNTLDECIEAWQTLCPLGCHPHPVDPSLATLAPSSTPAPAPSSGAKTTKPVILKREKTAVMRSPLGNAQKEERAGEAELASEPGPSVNFAIRGAGIVSSSPARTQRRYEALQRRGEEPDVLLTRSFARASLFALDAEADADQSDGERVVF